MPPSFNTFVPLSTSGGAAARSEAPDPTFGASPMSAASRAYERLDAATLTRANPPFDAGASGRLITSLTERGDQRDPRISRGYIRRTSVTSTDPTSSYRLYFMFNPNMIQRSYVSYLDQEALDPFNTIFGSQNLVSAPGVLDFGFDLFFDRQTENANGSMPRGVLEDFDYFDLVVRGVVPDPQAPDLPDNGVLLVNPRNITVVFSPQLSVQGRPDQVSVSYQKFDHRMRPVRMTISMSMKIFYIGPVRQDFTFAQSREEGTFSATVPYENSVPGGVQLDFESVKLAKAGLAKGSISSEFIQSNLIPPGSIDAVGDYPIKQGFSQEGHHGIDIGTPMGTMMVTPVDATVTFAGEEAPDSFGYLISVLTDDGLGPNGEQLQLLYGHVLPDAIAVNVGDHVTAGWYLGKTNNTGHSTGPHLHFEIRVGGMGGPPIDPMPYIQSGWKIVIGNIV